MRKVGVVKPLKREIYMIISLPLRTLLASFPTRGERKRGTGKRAPACIDSDSDWDGTGRRGVGRGSEIRFFFFFFATAEHARPRARARETATMSRPSTSYSDRFISSRRPARMADGMADVRTPEVSESEENDVYNTLLKHELLASRERRLTSPFSTSILGNTSVAALPFTRRSSRRIARSPFKVLDAPALADDFYLNLVDWSSQNILAVGLGACVYLWSASTSKVTTLCDLGPQDCVCSVSWTQRGTYLAVGTNQGEVQIWDATKVRCIRTVEGHRSRVGTLAWNSHTLSSGSRDRNILQHDVRSPEHYNSRLVGHRSEVCGLKWSPDGRELASGGNDNQLFIWNNSSLTPRLRFVEHTAAVKAIAWSPHQHGLLASGGGTADRCIRFWNTSTNTALHAVDTGSQVCNLMWSKNVNELVSTHGYSQNQIIVWRYPSLTKLTTLTGHTLRVLYLAMSPDGQTIVTGAGDETLRFWNVFPSQRLQGNEDSSAWSCGGYSCIR